ncbi:LacI family DNA-binding transcriptional regulator [Peloplasma aerotolerans]|jgi:LacI family transcriptional regulator|uniref:LacI family DNA-binding transcriptional regulator n=1 Tax=Peloplasma aerotolerans TaxID=3044389 RepID=A0AAW6UC67_9MOLU|nr:LacI family DNA-binding transcriptional regulator [Mariniplasma sp. M4Ah]MDI6453234.1 LacI family DNA-binding transcriptional regulator [Mariniplasma sp. M4Ah]
MMKPTIRDVAKKANVSVSTVSRVINQKGYVHEETKVLVNKIIKDLGFIPNQLARSLTNRSSKIIGVIVPHIGPSFYGELLEGIESQASAYGYKIMFCHTQDDPDRELEYLQFFESYNIEGLIIASNFSNRDKLAELNIPVVTVDHILDENIPSITSDNVKGGGLAATKLIETGAKNIILFRGPSFLLTTMERTIGFLNESKKHDLFVDIFDFDLLFPDFKLIEEILKNNPHVDGIFTFSDTLAFATLNILQKLGKKVPQDVSLIGYDNTPYSNWVTPSITTVHQSVNFMGKQSFINLTRLIRGVELDSLHDIIDVKLIERETTKSK